MSSDLISVCLLSCTLELYWYLFLRVVRQPVVIFPPEPIGDFCSNNITYEIKFVIPVSVSDSSNLTLQLRIQILALFVCFSPKKPVDTSAVTILFVYKN